MIGWVSRSKVAGEGSLSRLCSRQLTAHRVSSPPLITALPTVQRRAGAFQFFLFLFRSLSVVCFFCLKRVRGGAQRLTKGGAKRWSHWSVGRHGWTMESWMELFSCSSPLSFQLLGLLAASASLLFFLVVFWRSRAPTR